jgi:tRNA nucleotidyltransferase/poly(A) polymerase
VEKTIPPRALAEELRRIAAEDNPADILRALGEAGLLTLFSPVLAGAKINLPGITKFERLSRLLPDDARSRTARLGPFLWAFTEKLTPKEKQALIAATDMPKAQVDQWQKLEARAKKLETALRSARIRKASQVYHLVSLAAPDEVLFLLYHSAFKPVQERLRNYYQKYLPTIQEITAEEWAALEGKPGTPRQQKVREEFIAKPRGRAKPNRRPGGSSRRQADALVDGCQEGRVAKDGFGWCHATVGGHSHGPELVLNHPDGDLAALRPHNPARHHELHRGYVMQ